MEGTENSSTDNTDLKSTDSWLTSKETMHQLGITGCELMHRRLKGELVFKKKGNAYLYLLDAPLK